MIEQRSDLNSSFAAPPAHGWRHMLRLRWSERKLLLAGLDVVIVNAALYAALTLHADKMEQTNAWPNNAVWYFTLTAVWLTCALFFDFYNLALASDAEHSLQVVVAAVLLTTLIYTFTPYVTPPLSSRGVLLSFAVIMLAGVLAWRMTYVRLFGQPWFKQRALIVGTGPVGQELVNALQRNRQGQASPYHAAGYELVGLIETRDDVPSTELVAAVADVPVLGGANDLLALVRRLDVDEVIDAITRRSVVSDELFDSLLACHESGLRVTSMAAFYERVLGRVPVNSIGHHLSDVIQLEEGASYRLYQGIKRVLDVLACIPMAFVLGLAVPCVALANAISSPGPLFYAQTRVGRSGKPFRIYKFRSMRTDAEKDGKAVWAQGKDSRVTSVGRWLRRTRLDELPQCLNILRGDMSFIGPRPERPEFVEKLSEVIPYYRARHAVRPGLTGWAQVRFHYGASVEDSRIKLEYDLYYVKHSNPLLDIQILAQTLAVALQMKGT